MSRRPGLGTARSPHPASHRQANLGHDSSCPTCCAPCAANNLQIPPHLKPTHTISLRLRFIVIVLVVLPSVLAEDTVELMAPNHSDQARQQLIGAGEIVQIAGEMQGAVSASLISMDQFNEEVGHNIGGVRELSKILRRVMKTVHRLAPRFESVNQGMQMQSQVAQQVNVAICGFSQGAAKAAQLLQSTRATAQNLHCIATGLQA